MIKAVLVTTAAIGMMASATSANPEASAPQVQVCPNRDSGDPGQFLVASERAAREIFVAVERDYYPDADKKNFPLVRVRAEGGHWEVYRTRLKPQSSKDDRVIIYPAGHQLSMEIDKCTGAISGVYFMR